MNQQTKMSEQDTPQEGTNPEPEVVEETTEEETVETPAEVTEKTYTESQFRQMETRAKKAEAEARKVAPKAEAKTTSTLSNELIETTVLRSQGMSDEKLAYLKKLAAVNGTGLIEAQKDELFVNFVTKSEADAKAAKAKLGASKGSGSVKKEKSINSPGLTKEEHKALWREKAGV